MKSIALEFDGPVRAKFNSEVSGLMVSVQAAAVNILQPENFDPVHPDRGAGLQEMAFSGFVSGPELAGHAAKFAAVKTLTFLRTFTAGKPDGMRVLQFTPVKVGGGKMTISMLAETEDGLEKLQEKVDI